MIRLTAFATLLCMGTLLQAALPDAVIQACLSPSITETISNQTWQLMDAATWDSSPMRITETAEASITAQSGKPHPMEWATTEIAIAQPHDTPAQPVNWQTLTLSVRTKGIVPKLTCSFNFLDNAKLPPCTIITHQGKLTIVSNQKDWYIVAEDPAMTITQTDEAAPRTTLCLPNIEIAKFDTYAASIRVGEGPLP